PRADQDGFTRSPARRPPPPRRQERLNPHCVIMPLWFKPSMVVLAGMILLLLAGAPRGDSTHPTWITSLADPMTLRLLGAVLMGVGVYWGLVVYHQRRKKR